MVPIMLITTSIWIQKPSIKSKIRNKLNKEMMLFRANLSLITVLWLVENT